MQSRAAPPLNDTNKCFLVISQTEKIPETHENGSVNGLSAGVPAPASEISGESVAHRLLWGWGGVRARSPFCGPHLPSTLSMWDQSRSANTETPSCSESTAGVSEMNCLTCGVVVCVPAPAQDSRCCRSLSKSSC